MKLTRRKILRIILAVGFVFSLGGFIAGSLLAARQPNRIAGGQESERICPQGERCVYLYEDGAKPDILTATAGSFVQFISADNKSHSLSLGKGGEEHEHEGPFTSGVFAADEAWRVQFKEAGTYYFHDHFSPNISAAVIIYQD